MGDWNWAKGRNQEGGTGGLVCKIYEIGQLEVIPPPELDWSVSSFCSL